MSRPSDSRKKLGRWGEDVAALQLEANGLTIVEHNWRCSLGEIDLVARDDEVLVFVEVKTRKGRAFGAPEESLTPAKAQKLMQLGLQYVADHDLEDVGWRIDLVAVELDESGRLLRCDHIPNAVLGW
ncbi:MAG TPA: YraN family protein [Promineifilum sp.]